MSEGGRKKRGGKVGGKEGGRKKRRAREREGREGEEREREGREGEEREREGREREGEREGRKKLMKVCCVVNIFFISPTGSWKLVHESYL